MSAAPSPPPPPPAPPPPPPRLGRLIFGVLLVLLGVGWLLEVLGVTEFPWDVLLPAALIGVGVALILVSRTGSGHGGLLTTGVVLTVVLVLGSVLDVPIAGGVGDRDVRPASVDDLRDDYRLGIGQLLLDLSGLSPTDLEGTSRRVDVEVGIGEAVVIVAEDVSVQVRAHAGVGDVTVFGSSNGGVDVERTASPEGPLLALLELDVSVGLGEVEVRRG